jgi:DNA-binding Lrp family transcriptional regulator
VTSRAPHGDRPAGAAPAHAPDGYGWTVVVDWIYQCCEVEQARYLSVLLAVARHCTALDGTGAHPSMRRLASFVNVTAPTVAEVVERLEARGELVVERPAVRGRGRYNHYVVVMGRPVEECRLLLPGAVPGLSGAALTIPSGAVPTAPGAAQEHPGQSPGMVGESSENGRRTLGPEPNGSRSRSTDRASASRSSAARARPSPLDPRVQEVRDIIEDAGVLVRWDLEPGQQAVIAAQVVTCGAPALAREALGLAAAKGAPTSARAWLTPWELLPPPDNLADLRRTDWCGQCESPAHRWLVGDDGLPVEPATRCPRCHPSATAVPF